MTDQPDRIPALPRADQLLFLPEVAGRLRCSVKTVRRLIEEEKLTACKVRGRVVVESRALAAYWEQVTAPRKVL